MRFPLKIIIPTLTFFLFVIFFACKKGHRIDCLKANGEEITEVRDVGTFRSVAVYNKIDLEIVPGNECRVEVTAGKHIIKGVLTKMQGDSIIIENSNLCNWVRGYKKKIKVRLTMPYLKRIYNWGVGPITFDNSFKQDTNFFARAENSGDTYINGTYQQISTSSHGNGDMIIGGSAKELLVYTNGTNFTRAENLQVSDHVFISSYSIGDVYLNLEGTKNFEYHIWTSGNIYYRGNPLSITDAGSEGTGKLIRLD